MAPKRSPGKKGKSKKASPAKRPATTVVDLFKKQFLQQNLQLNSSGETKSSKDDSDDDDVSFVKEERAPESSRSTSATVNARQINSNTNNTIISETVCHKSSCNRDKTAPETLTASGDATVKPRRLAQRLSLRKNMGKGNDDPTHCGLSTKVHLANHSYEMKDQITNSSAACLVASKKSKTNEQFIPTPNAKLNLHVQKSVDHASEASDTNLSPDSLSDENVDDSNQLAATRQNKVQDKARTRKLSLSLKRKPGSKIDASSSASTGARSSERLILQHAVASATSDVGQRIPHNETSGRADESESQNLQESETREDGDEEGAEEPVPRVPYYWENFNTVIKSVFGDEYNQHLFDESDLKHLEEYNSLTESSQKLYVRLFSRKLAWLLTSKIKYPLIADDLTPHLNELVTTGLLSSGEKLDDLSVVLNALPAPELRNLAKSYHLNPAGQQKSQLVQALVGKSQQNTVASLFGQKIGGVKVAMLKKAKQILGPVYQLAREARAMFVRAMMLSSLVSTTGDEESGNGGQGQLFQMLLVNIGRRVYPTYNITRHTRLFSCRQDLIRFEEALQLESELLGYTGNGNWSGAYTSYLAVKERYEVMIRDKKITDWDGQLPDFLRLYTAGSVLVRLLSQGIEILQRRKDYTAAVALIRQLLQQGVYNPDLHGYWWDRLALNLDVHLKQQEQALQAVQDGLADPQVRTGHRLSLFQRAETICSKPKSAFKKRLKDFSHEPLVDLPKQYVDGRVLPHTLPGSRYQFITETSFTDRDTEEVTMCNVEQIVLDYYRSNGFPQGIHAEGSIVSSLFCLYLWEEMFGDVADAFHSPYQTTPLDFHSDSFYQRRQKQIDLKLSTIEHSSEKLLLSTIEETWTQYYGVMCAGINWERFSSVQELQGLVQCMGGKVLAGILLRYAKQPRHTRGGFPDLTLWNTETKSLKISEVKGPGDRLSHKQMLWLDFLLKLGVDAEVCHVKPVGVKKLKRCDTPQL